MEFGIEKKRYANNQKRKKTNNEKNRKTKSRKKQNAWKKKGNLQILGNTGSETVKQVEDKIKKSIKDERENFWKPSSTTGISLKW